MENCVTGALSILSVHINNLPHCLPLCGVESLTCCPFSEVQSSFITIIIPYSISLIGEALAKIRIENMVATTSLGKELDLKSISKSFERAQYDQERFPGLVYRLDKSKVVALLFGSGKIVLTGAKKTEDIELAVERITKELRDASQLR